MSILWRAGEADGPEHIETRVRSIEEAIASTVMDRPHRGPNRLDIRELDERGKDLHLARLGAGYRVQEVDAYLDQVFEALSELAADNEALRTGVSPASLWLGAAPARPRLGPLDVQQKVFDIARLGSGYKMRDVDEFLDEVTDVLAALVAENDALREKPPPSSG